MCCALLALVGGILAGSASAGEYPDRPIRLILGVGPGGAPDITARIFASKLGEILGQQVVVDNRPGAGGIIGMEVVAREPRAWAGAKFDAFYKSEVTRWVKVARKAGIKPE